MPAFTDLFDTFLLCVPVHCILLSMELRWCHVLLPLTHFEGILKGSLPSTDENLSCSSGIEVQCYHVIKWDLVLLMGKIELCICVWTNLQGDWGKYDRED